MGKAEVIRIGDPEQPLLPQHAAKLIRRLWRQGKVTWRDYGAAERKQERGFTTLEVEALIINGFCVGPSGKSDGRWSYEIEDRQQTKRLVASVGRDLLHIVTIVRNAR
jgi:hypothetical protein